MTVYNPVPSTASWVWGAGSSSSAVPNLKKRLTGTVGWTWQTSSTTVRRIIPAPASVVSWQFGSAGQNPELKELLTDAGVQLKVYDRVTGDLLGVVQYESLSFENALNETGSGKLTLDKRKLTDMSWLESDLIWRVEIEGQERFAFVAEQIEDQSVDQNESYLVSIGGRGVACLLEWAAVYPLGDQITRSIEDQSLASVMVDLVNEAHARGTIENVTVSGWNALKDWNGIAWTDSNRLEFEAGGSLLDKLGDWQGIEWEWRMNPRLGLELAGSFGRNVSNTVVLSPGLNVSRQTTTRDLKNLRNVLMTQDQNDGFSEVKDNASIAEWTRREQYVVFDKTVNEGSRTSAGYGLLNLVKNATVERRVEVDPFAEGRRPFVNFDLGDIVGVEFETEVFEFRVLAIAVAADENGSLRAEVTLDYVLEAERKRRESLLGGSSGGGGGGGSQLVEKTEISSVLVDVSGTEVCLIPFEAYRATYGLVGISFDGVASAAQLLTIKLKAGDAIVRTWRHRISAAGADMGSITWAWVGIPEGSAALRLNLSVSAGTFLIPEFGVQLYVQADGIAGNVGAGSPSAMVSDPVAYASDPSDSASWVFPAWAGGGFLEAAETYTVTYPTDDIDEAVMISTTVVTVSGDDGYTTSLPLFSANGTFTVAGNQSGLACTAWYRFDLPSGLDLTGATIDTAVMIGNVDSTAYSALTTVRAVVGANPLAPSDRADLLGRTLTTAAVDWDGDSVALQTVTSSNLAPVIQELIDTYGDLESILIVQDDRSGPVDGRFAIRSADNAVSDGMTLRLNYRN